jgi:hypothetical protein
MRPLEYDDILEGGAAIQHNCGRLGRDPWSPLLMEDGGDFVRCPFCNGEWDKAVLTGYSLTTLRMCFRLVEQRETEPQLVLCWVEREGAKYVSLIPLKDSAGLERVKVSL